MRDVPRPNRIVLLDADLGALIERIRLRGRAMERGISREYLAELRAAYAEWEQAPPAPLIRIDTTHLRIPYSQTAQKQVLEITESSLDKNLIGALEDVSRRQARASGHRAS